MAPSYFFQTQQPTSWIDDQSSVFDDSILEPSAFDTSPDTRRESMMDASNMYSTFDFDTDMMTDAPTAVPVFEHSNGTNNPFVKLETQQFQQQQQQQQQQQSWAPRAEAPAVSAMPFDSNVFGAQTFDMGFQSFAPVPAMPATIPTTFETASSGMTMFSPQPSMGPSSVSSPAEGSWSPADTPKPQNATLTSSNTSSKGPSSAKSPAPRAPDPLNIRRDGIRKKNARFEIPAERTLLTIDTLISQSQDDHEIKELKQQKRLLRNRQAALDSRQRKKQHTERLEEEKKIHATIIAELEERLALLQTRDNEWRQRVQEAVQERDAFRHQVEVLQMEKEELVKTHTIETGDLRKKNNFLVAQCQKLENMLENAGGAAAPSAGTYDDEFDLDNEFWAGSPFNGVDNFEPLKPVVKKEAKPVVTESEEKPVQGLLLILLLCGALVASSGSSANGTNSVIPTLPQPIRTASAGILQNIFSEAGVQQNSQGRIMEAPDASSVSNNWLSTSSGSTVSLQSSLDLLASTLSAPTAEQEHEELTVLNANEYDSVMSKDFREPESVATKGRRQIQEGLASMRANKGASAAEVYTRSLLWDRVDAEVVRRFAAFAQKAQQSAHESSSADAMSL